MVVETVIDNPIDSAYFAFKQKPSDDTALAWLQKELAYQFMDGAGIPQHGPLEDSVYDSIVDQADRLMKSRKNL